MSASAALARRLVGPDSPAWLFAREAYYGALLLSGSASWRRRRQQGGVLVLTAHSFCTDVRPGPFGQQPISAFARHLRRLAELYDIVSLELAVERLDREERPIGRNGKPLAVLTVDDGFADNFEILTPVLDEAGIPAAFFLATAFLDDARPPWPVEIAALLEQTELRSLTFPLTAPIGTRAERAAAAAALKRVWKLEQPDARRDRLDELRRHLRVTAPKFPRPLGWNQVRAMRDRGHTIGAHTVHHSILPLMPELVARQELSESKARIEAELGRVCWAVAYPNGDWDDRTADLAAATGFRLGLTQDSGVNRHDTPRLALRRVNLPPSDGLAAFAGRISLAHD